MTNQATDMTDKTQPEAGSTHIIRYALELGLLWINGDGRNKVREALDALDILEAEPEAVGAGGVQALSAVPAGWRVVPENATDAMVFAGCTVDNATHMKVENSALKAAVWSAMLAAAPKAAPGELHDHQILAITTAYEQGVGKGHQAHESGKEIANPYGTGYRCDLAWQYGYKEGKEQAERIAKAAPTPPAEQQAEESHVKLLAECRDAFPIPEPGSPLEVQWAAAMARPEEVPEYVRLCVAAMQAAPKAAPVEQLTRDQIREVFMAHGFTIKEGQTDLKQYVYDAAYALLKLVAAPQQEAQEPVALHQVYRCKIKSRKQIDKEIPRESQGWWADVAAGQKLLLRQAVQSDLDRCNLGGKRSKDPNDYMCETQTNGSLVSKVALEYMNPEQNVFASTAPHPAPACHHRPPCAECASLTAQERQP